MGNCTLACNVSRVSLPAAEGLRHSGRLRARHASLPAASIQKCSHRSQSLVELPTVNTTRICTPNRLPGLLLFTVAISLLTTCSQNSLAPFVCIVLRLVFKSFWFSPDIVLSGENKAPFSPEQSGLSKILARTPPAQIIAPEYCHSVPSTAVC